MSRRQSPTLRRVLDGKLCAGCGLCASVSDGAVAMEIAEPGFARPTQRGQLSDRAERLIAEACPGVVVQDWDSSASTHPYWGPYRTVSTGHATDEGLRFRASSGGALTALVVHALRSGVIDRAVHVTADPCHPTRNKIVVSQTETEITSGAGSRYSASSPLEIIDAQLHLGGRFALVGKPCDVSALRRLARHDERVSRHVALMLSFFCAGIPSTAAAGRILDAMGVCHDEVQAFRYRGNGWPGSATATLHDGTNREMSYADSWGAVLSKEVQFRCKICPDAVGGVADIACADAWYGDDDGYPSFEETDGRSLILARTAAGQALLETAVSAGDLLVEPIDVGQIERMQPSQARRKRLVASRQLALAATLQAAPVVAGTCVKEAAKTASAGEQARSFLGTARRVLLGGR